MMNFIRDIIGEKRQSAGKASSPPDGRPDDRSLMASASPRPQIQPDQPEDDRAKPVPASGKTIDGPLAALDDDAIWTTAGWEPETDPDPSGEISEDEPLEDDDAVLTAPERDVYAELRSIFVAEQKDRILEDAPEIEDAPSGAGHAPLRAAIARVERAYSTDEDDTADDDASEPIEAGATRTDDVDGAPEDGRDEPVDAVEEEPGDIQPEPAQEPVRDHKDEPAVTAPPVMPRVEQTVAVPGPAMGRGSSSKGRVKTRLLGFNTERDEEIDPISGGQAAKPAAYTKFPLGWLIVTDGPGRGAAFTLFNGVSQIGRGTNQTISLDFGDNSISRENHAAIAYDHTQNRFFIGHGGKANLVRRNERPVLATEELAAGDRITIGETTLRFVPLCGEDFSWQTTDEGHWSDAANG